jgi:hypothetical protein
MTVLEALWGLLTAAGGTLALALIVSLAVGINALTLLFLGSAVVTLERFARAAHRWTTLAVVTVFWILVVAAAVAAWGDLPLESEHWSRWQIFGAALPGSALIVVFTVFAVRTALRRVSPALLADASAVVLGLGYAMVLGATGRVLYAAAPAGVAALGALLAGAGIRSARVSARSSASCARSRLRSLRASCSRSCCRSPSAGSPGSVPA